ncbi:hypothetical protein [Nonomuraea candida]|uniref:hypothetical protein n=1 Tax=Nonomuraea candida TaxID=359159 RepID=UPI0012F80931|nr:hypothetical protein [Nonomuraea candida]
MDFWKAISVLFRRWYVALSALLLTVTAAYGMYTTIPTQYTSTTLMVLTVPPSGSYRMPQPTVPNPLVNPLLNFDGGLNMTASIMVQVLNGPEVAGQLGVRADSTTTYRVHNGHPNPELLINAPFVVVEGTSLSPQDARRIVERVAERAKVELERRQYQLGSPPETFVNLTEMIAPTEPQAERGGKTRTAAVVLGLGGMAALAASYAADSVMLGLRRRREQPPPGAAVAPSEEAVLQR